MKNIFIVISSVLFTILIGSFFIDNGNNEQSVSNELTSVKAVQIGAYEDEKDALYVKNNIGGEVIHDKDFYYVYMGIIQDSNNLERMINYLNTNNIYYYLKDIVINDEFKSELIKYETLMKETTSDIAFIELNKKVVEYYGGIYEN